MNLSDHDPLQLGLFISWNILNKMHYDAEHHTTNNGFHLTEDEKTYHQRLQLIGLEIGNSLDHYVFAVQEAPAFKEDQKVLNAVLPKDINIVYKTSHKHQSLLIITRYPIFPVQETFPERIQAVDIDINGHRHRVFNIHLKWHKRSFELIKERNQLVEDLLESVPYSAVVIGDANMDFSESPLRQKYQNAIGIHGTTSIDKHHHLHKKGTTDIIFYKHVVQEI